MKIPEMNKVYVLNPHYHLRHDIHRVALFSSTGTDTDCSRNWHTFIHPLQAVMLSFFTYDRPLQTTLPLAVRLLLPEQGGDDQMGIGLH